MSRVGSAPKAILAILQKQDEDCPLVMKDINNQKAFLRNLELYGRTPIERLLDNFHATIVVHAYERNKEGHITHLFFVQPVLFGCLLLHEWESVK